MPSFFGRPKWLCRNAGEQNARWQGSNHVVGLARGAADFQFAGWTAMTRDFYRILGVHPSSEENVIRAAYRSLAQRYHPDKCLAQDAVTLNCMQEINEAYAVLADETRRRDYDEYRGSSGSKDFPGAYTESCSRFALNSRDSIVADRRNRVRLKESFLTVQELQRPILPSRRIISVA